MSEFEVDRARERHRRLILVGPSGSGKSVIAPRTARAVGWQVFDTDDDVLSSSCRSSVVEIFELDGERRFRDLELECIRRLSCLREPVVVATGGGMPAIPGAMEYLNTLGVTVFLKASVETLWARLCMDPVRLSQRPLLQKGGISALSGMVESRNDLYNRAAIAIDTDQLSVDEVCLLLASNVSVLEAGYN